MPEEHRAPTQHVASRGTPSHYRRFGGRTLYVKGLADSPVIGHGCAFLFNPARPVSRDTHIRELGYLQASPEKQPFAPQPFLMRPTKSPSESRLGSSAFAAMSSPNGVLRHSYVARSTTPPATLYDHPSCFATSPSRSSQCFVAGTAAFRSRVKIACAHVDALQKPVEPHWVASESDPAATTASPRRRQCGTASFAATGDRDSYIRAMPQRLDAYSPLKSDFDYSLSRRRHTEGTAAFRSKTSIADAHIRAAVKPVDVCVAFTS